MRALNAILLSALLPLAVAGANSFRATSFVQSPAPQPVTAPRVEVAARVPGKMPQGLLTTFWNGPFSRGFSWQTDTSVTETKLWLLEGEYGPGDDGEFEAMGTLHSGEKTVVALPAMHCHRLHVEGLKAGQIYSYRLGGNGNYAYGSFKVKGGETAVTAVTFSDTQTKYADLLYKAENTLAVASRTAGEHVDLVVSGGDLFDVSQLNNANHVVYGAAVPGNYKEWKWALMVDLLAPYFPGVPWITVPGNHDYDYYRKLTAVDYHTNGMVNAGCSAVDLGNVHFVQLPFLGNWSASGVPAQYQAAFEWLQRDLAASSAKWKVVCVHWGPYTTGDHGTGIGRSEGVDDYVRALVPIVSSNHVDLVVQAHDHTFSKSVPYCWDTVGYTREATDTRVLKLNPERVTLDGKIFDLDPRGTYYVSAGCAGHRSAEEPDYPTSTGSKSYTLRDLKIVMGRIAVKSRFRNVGDEATGDFADIDPAGFQMFGLLKVRGDRLTYEFYVAEADGSATLIDELNVCKPSAPPADGTRMMLW